MIQSLAEKFWQARLSQNKDLALELFAQAKRTYGLTPNQSFIELLGTPSGNLNEIVNLIDLSACEVSVLRLLKRFDESKALVSLISKNAEAGDLRTSFYFQFEQGLTFFVQSQWNEALECFQNAVAMPTSANQAAATTLNCLLCLENLSLSTEQICAEFKAKLLQTQEPVTSGLRYQFQAFGLRQAWRQGRIDLIASSSDKTSLNQNLYLEYYLKSLPYFEVKSFDLKAELSQLSGQQFNQSFRVLTLLGTNDPATGIVRLSDWIERLYLWTWKWLKSSDQFSVYQVIECLNKIQDEVILRWDDLAVDDKTMFLLSLRWLCAFDQTSELRLRSLWSLQPNTGISAVWTLEWETQQALFLRKDQDLTFTIMHPLIKYFETLFSNLTTKTPAAISSGFISIDTLRSTISFTEDRSIQSPTICRALEQLVLLPAIEISSFAKDVFGISEYDHFLHYNKVSNLLSRLNAILPREFKVKQREGRITLLGPRDAVQLLNLSAEAQTLQRSLPWKEICRNLSLSFQTLSTKTSILPTALKRLQAEGEFTRLRFQQEIKVSKSQAQRLLADLLNDKIIFRRGHSRSVHYEFVEMRRAL